LLTRLKVDKIRPHPAPFLPENTKGINAELHKIMMETEQLKPAIGMILKFSHLLLQKRIPLNVSLFRAFVVSPWVGGGHY
jgi:hypothetical protein